MLPRGNYFHLAEFALLKSILNIWIDKDLVISGNEDFKI